MDNAPIEKPVPIIQDPQALLTHIVKSVGDLTDKALSLELLPQWVLILFAAALSHFIAQKIQKRFLKKRAEENNTTNRYIYRAIKTTAFPSFLTFFLFLGLIGFHITTGSYPQPLVAINKLAFAWIFVRLVSLTIKTPAISKFIAISIWLVIALHITESLQSIILELDKITPLGAVGEDNDSVTLLDMIRGLLTVTALMWGALTVSKLMDKQVKQIDGISPSLRVLIGKIIKISLIGFALLIGLNTLGLDLTAFAVFSGAIGVGIGFGLQKVVSNFISGIILLMDRSIKPGDVIKIDDTYGWVNSLNARFVSVITRDGKEHLIPNELLITEKVENWSYSNQNVRIKIPVGISYNNDPNEALAILMKVAEENKRVLGFPKPNALLRGFGDSSVDLELRCWINDPPNGMGNIESDLLLDIWNRFKEAEIEIPYPQQDIYIKSMPKKADD